MLVVVVVVEGGCGIVLRQLSMCNVGGNVEILFGKWSFDEFDRYDVRRLAANSFPVAFSLVQLMVRMIIGGPTVEFNVCVVICYVAVCRGCSLASLWEKVRLRN